ncbi:MAG: GTP 3',8-cyclase MoaA [Proteobacteria bacterium]|nr:GTP 3',8-cyclase MoaA [Pseudomonadota bacterium]
MKQLTDNYKRKLKYLRVSVTDRCNLRCNYCNPLTPQTMLTHDDILQYEEILRIIKAGVGFGINKIRVTGGEPLVRKGLCGFIAELNKISELKDVSLTTNGVLLKDYIDELIDAGIKRINISLDSINKENFAKITGRDYFEKVWEGVELALKKGIEPLKINVVAMRGVNSHEFLDFARLTFDYPLQIRFIEYMPIGDARMQSRQQILTPETKEILQELGELIPVKNQANDGPAFRYRFSNAKGEIGFISPISRHFCSDCNRLRLTANGKIRSCLLSDHQFDIKTPLRNGMTDDEIRNLFKIALNNKAGVHCIGSSEDYKVNTNMSAIGG